MTMMNLSAKVIELPSDDLYLQVNVLDPAVSPVTANHLTIGDVLLEVIGVIS
jgi:hypothetical protein